MKIEIEASSKEFVEKYWPEWKEGPITIGKFSNREACQPYSVSDEMAFSGILKGMMNGSIKEPQPILLEILMKWNIVELIENLAMSGLAQELHQNSVAPRQHSRIS